MAFHVETLRTGREEERRGEEREGEERGGEEERRRVSLEKKGY